MSYVPKAQTFLEVCKQTYKVCGKMLLGDELGKYVECLLRGLETYTVTPAAVGT